MSLPTENLRSPAAMGRFLLTAIVGIALDLWTKSLAFEKLNPDSQLRIIPDLIHLHVTKNFGAVFGVGQNMTSLFIVISVGAIAFLFYLFASSERQRFFQVVLGMLLAGVIGNMYDRVHLGYVRDMIHALPGWRWPGHWSVPFIQYPGAQREVFPWIFNVADILLCVGVGLMIIYSFVSRRPVPANETPAMAK